MKLRSKFQGQIIGEIELIDGSEYFIGRAQSCDLCLDKLKGVSRKHVKVSQGEQGMWIAQTISSFNKLNYNEDSVQEIILDKNLSFYLLSYEIDFIFEAEEEEGEEPSKPQPLVPTIPHALEKYSHDHTKEDNATTASGLSRLIPYLEILWTHQPKESIPLNGEAWVVGRDDSADITIPKKKVSRKQFQITREDDNFYISDLGSSNGTLLNNKKLAPQQTQPLNSNDVISIRTIKIKFLIKNESLDKALQRVSSPLEHVHENLPNVIRISSSEDLKDSTRSGLRKNMVRGLLAVVSIFLVYHLINDSNSPKEETSPEDTNDTNFSNEQQMIVQDMLNLSRTHYTKGEYDLCLSEIKKLHQQVASYKNSKEIQKLCEAGKDLKLHNIERERREKEEKSIRMEVEIIIQKCKQQINSQTSIHQLESCLSAARERDPSNPDIGQLIEQIRDRDQKRAENQKNQARYNNKVQQGKRQYEKAKEMYNSGSLASAIRLYQQYLDTSFPDPHGFKYQAKRELASIKKEFSQKINREINKCKDFLASQKYKEAIQSCDSALLEDPSNKEAESLRGTVISALRKKMKNIYEDSVLEEQFGNIQLAKKKWNQIIQESTPDEEYFKRAKSKLKKYNMGYGGEDENK